MYEYYTINIIFVYVNKFYKWNIWNIFVFYKTRGIVALYFSYLYFYKKNSYIYLMEIN